MKHTPRRSFGRLFLLALLGVALLPHAALAQDLSLIHI